MATGITRPDALLDWQALGANPLLFPVFPVRMRTLQGTEYNCCVNPVDLAGSTAGT